MSFCRYTVIFHNVEMSFFHFTVSAPHKNQDKERISFAVYTDNNVAKKQQDDLQEVKSARNHLKQGILSTDQKFTNLLHILLPLCVYPWEHETNPNPTGTAGSTSNHFSGRSRPGCAMLLQHPQGNKHLPWFKHNCLLSWGLPVT